jgi:exonuclease III
MPHSLAAARKMKIATWNIDRLKHKSNIVLINSIIAELKADILVLTETDNRVDTTNYKFCIQTPKPIEFSPDFYLVSENRVTICTNYEIVRQHETYDKYTSLCVELKTELGLIIVYGTIIGILGISNKSFKIDLSQQINDYKNLSKEKNFCLIGDFNITFADNYYFTNHGRNELNKVFKECNLNLLTSDRKECVDHIAISENFTTNLETEIGEWNLDKKLSDHKGIYVVLNNKS